MVEPVLQNKLKLIHFVAKRQKKNKAFFFLKYTMKNYKNDDPRLEMQKLQKERERDRMR